MTFNLKTLVFLSSIILVNSIIAQTQKGLDIDGEAALDGSGNSISICADGNTLAIGAKGNDEAGPVAGHVRVYRWDETVWIQKGNDIDGEAAGDRSGSSVSLSTDGNTLAIGAIQNDGAGSNAGHVRIYKWDGTTWIQKGSDIDGEAIDNQSGNSVMLSADGNTVVIGSYYNSNEGFRSGQVRVYTWNDPLWIQKGVEINGQATEDECGYSVSMSDDGNIIAMGARYNDGAGSNAGNTRVYFWDGLVWTQKGFNLDGEAENDLSGWSVSLSSDGNTIAIGATENDGVGSSAGHVRIYTWDGFDWIQKGLDIDGEAEYNDSGYSVSLSSDGNIVAIGAPQNNGAMPSGNFGHVRIYDWNGFAWIQKGIDIDGEGFNDFSGKSVSLSSDGLTVAIGAESNDGSGSNAGHVRVYEFCEEITNTIATEACNTFTVPSGDEIYSESGVYIDTIPRAFNCGDSILTIDVTINHINVNVNEIAFDTLQADASGIGISYQWIDCSDSSEIAGATEQTFGAPTNGNYAVIINQDGCSDTSACYEIEGVGISEMLLNEINIYPNPSSGLVYIQSENVDIASIKLYNSVGQLVKWYNPSASYAELNLKNFERGVYTLLVETSGGLVRKQIVLQ